MKITKNTLKQMIREEINDIGLPEPELDPESPFARFYEIMVGSDRHPSEYALISRVERCLQDPEGAGACADIANAASNANFELRRKMSSEIREATVGLRAALAYLSDIPQNPKVHAGWKLNPSVVEELKRGFEEFKQVKPHRSFALEEKKITKKQLTQIILEEFEGILAEDAAGMGLRKWAQRAADVGLALWEQRGGGLHTTAADKKYALEVAAAEINKMAKIEKLTSDDIILSTKQITPGVVAEKLCDRNAVAGTDCSFFRTIRPAQFPKGS